MGRVLYESKSETRGDKVVLNTLTLKGSGCGTGDIDTKGKPYIRKRLNDEKLDAIVSMFYSTCCHVLVKLPPSSRHL